MDPDCRSSCWSPLCYRTYVWYQPGNISYDDQRVYLVEGVAGVSNRPTRAGRLRPLEAIIMCYLYHAPYSTQRRYFFGSNLPSGTNWNAKRRVTQSRKSKQAPKAKPPLPTSHHCHIHFSFFTKRERESDRIMASFCNQNSNLSALNSALTSFSKVLDISENTLSSLTQGMYVWERLGVFFFVVYIGIPTRNFSFRRITHIFLSFIFFSWLGFLYIEVEHEENAERFIENQHRRIEAIDAMLLKATTNILPPSREARTVTELAEVCRLIQETTRQKIGHLRTRFDLMGIQSTWHDSITSSPTGGGNRQVGKTTTSSHNITTDLPPWSILGGGGIPLDCVIEGDVETEGATTPGSLLQASPFPTTTKTHPNAQSLTPPTPTLNRFSFRYVSSMNECIYWMGVTSSHDSSSCFSIRFGLIPCYPL